MIGLLIELLVLLIVFSLAWWVLSMLPLPAPIKQIATVVIVVIFAIVLIYWLLALTGTAPPAWRRW